MKTQLSLLLSFLLTLCIATAQDQLLVKDTGEVLRGKYIQTKDGIIEFDSSTFGTLKVSEKKATVTKNVGPAQPSATPTPKTPKDTKSFVHKLLHLPDEFEGKLTLGWNSINGTSKSEETSISTEFGMVQEHNIWNVFGSYDYQKTEGQTSQDNWRYGAWDKWFFNKDDLWFLYVQSSQRQDTVQKLQSEWDSMLALGYNLLKGEQYKLQVSVGGNYDVKNYFDIVVPGARLSIPTQRTWRIGAYEQFTWTPLSYVHFSQHLLYAFDPNDSDDYDYNLNATLSTPLTAHLSLALVYERTWNGGISPVFLQAGIEKHNTDIGLQLQYKF